MKLSLKNKKTKQKKTHTHTTTTTTTTTTMEILIKETLLALVRDLFTFSSKVIKRFILV
jgi:hypothetical protein